MSPVPYSGPYYSANATPPDCHAAPLPHATLWTLWALWTIVAATALAVFFLLLVFALLALLGRGKFYRAQAYAANALVVLPANVVLVSAFVLGTPVRLVPDPEPCPLNPKP